MHNTVEKLLLIATAIVVVSASAATPSSAQGYPFSQRGSVSQTVAFTDISIEYGRPTARGRKLFGELVPWDSVWHPGADQATRISIKRDIVLEKQPVRKGTYTIWLIPREHTPWTFILSRATNIPHKPYPGAAMDALRVDVMPDQASHIETLTYFFPAVLKDETTLRLQWGETGVPIHIKAPYRPNVK